MNVKNGKLANCLAMKTEFVIKVMLVNWVVNADFYLLASYSLSVYMNYNINLR
ncbi:hypothetical protein T05_14521 [Trichinella murrelli]|uniref:Uncharacterized protein n=1 Tax=Trichinella murrelli TaxID=144512 RepID=A0A0V0SZ78_9BILA|nr:hypothetical protein T05_14521 [Trichinella murrelli]